MVTMDQAEKIAADFVKRKKPNAEVEVLRAKKRRDRWVVEGKADSKDRVGRIYDRWSVTIEGDEVTEYEIEPSGGYAITGGPRRG